MNNDGNYKYGCNQKLYEFLATSYDISDLASKIAASKKAPASIWNLKHLVNNKDEDSIKSA